MLAGIPTAAQDSTQADNADWEKKGLLSMGRLTHDYWTPRLNDYKQQIDRVMTADDLAELEALRIRWGIVIDMNPHWTIERDRLFNNFEPGANSGLPSPMKTFESAQQLASRNRAALDTLHGRIIADLNGYIASSIALADRFFQENHARMDAQDVEAWPHFRERVRSPSGRATLIADFDSIYRQDGQALLMLYNGESVLRLLGMVFPYPMPFFSDLNIDQDLMLLDVDPSGASTSTWISYALRESSSRTSIEIFDTAGTRRLHFDQGFRERGEHLATIDVSTLAPGFYLYRVVAQLANGRQVSSRVMHVYRQE